MLVSTNHSRYPDVWQTARSGIVIISLFLCPTNFALAFTPTQQEACCLSFAQGTPNPQICQAPLPSAAECAARIGSMARAADTHWKMLNGQHSKEIAKVVSTTQQMPNGQHNKEIVADKNNPLGTTGLGIILLLAAGVAKTIKEKKFDGSSLQGRVNKFVGFLSSALSFMIFCSVACYFLIVAACSINNICSTSNILIFYILAAIPVWFIMLAILIRKLIKSDMAKSFKTIIWALGILGLSAIFYFRIGT